MKIFDGKFSRHNKYIRSIHFSQHKFDVREAKTARVRERENRERKISSEFERVRVFHVFPHRIVRFPSSLCKFSWLRGEKEISLMPDFSYCLLDFITFINVMNVLHTVRVREVIAIFHQFLVHVRPNNRRHDDAKTSENFKSDFNSLSHSTQFSWIKINGSDTWKEFLRVEKKTFLPLAVTLTLIF